MICKPSGILDLYPQYVFDNSSTANEVILYIFNFSNKLRMRSGLNITLIRKES